MAKDTGTETSVDEIKGWFAGRLPDGWFTGVEVTLDGDQIVVVGTLPAVELAKSATAAEKSGAAEGRISRFREETRGERIWIAREAEAKFEKNVTWGASIGDARKTFTPGGSGRSESGEAKKVMIGMRPWLYWAWRRRFGRGFGRRFGPRVAPGSSPRQTYF
jgi:hypothetical protein